MQTVFYSIVSAVILLLQVSECRGDVMVFDAVTTLDHPIFIRVLTKGRFFSAGGKRVTVHIGREAPQPMLTGGDGYGRLKYVPTMTGLIKLVVKYGPETDTANLLVMDKEDRALLVEIDAGLRAGPFSSAQARFHLAGVHIRCKDDRQCQTRQKGLKIGAFLGQRPDDH